MIVRVGAAGGGYDVTVEPGQLSSAGAVLGLADLVAGARARRIFVVSTPPVYSLYGLTLERALEAAHAEFEAIMMPDGEGAKTLANVEDVIDELVRRGARRDSLIVALGGGSVGDAAGFVAAIYQRGIAWAVIPTTLLAMADASIGGKVAVNHHAVKNLMGAFHPPRAVLIDPEILATLPARQLRSGAYEVLKAGILGDAGLFDVLAARGIEAFGTPALATGVIGRAVAVKARIVSADERERDTRRVLNLGHTLGHGLEAAGGYRLLTHGEAVGWGMLAAIGMAERRGILAAPAAVAMRAAILKIGELPPIAALPRQAIAAAIARDKKNFARQNVFVLPVAVGEVVIAEDVTAAEIDTALGGLGGLFDGPVNGLAGGPTGGPAEL